MKTSNFDEDRLYDRLVNGSQDEANEVLLEKIAATLVRPDLTVADTIKLIQEYRAIRHELGGNAETSPLAQVLDMLGDDRK